MATCEWNPERDRSAFVGEEGHGEATVIVGADGAYHLCESCAALPRFARFKKRPMSRRVPERRYEQACPNCGGMGTTTHDILVGGTEHDTEERDCEVCKGTGRRQEDQ